MDVSFLRSLLGSFLGSFLRSFLGSFWESFLAFRRPPQGFETICFKMILII